MNLKLILTRIKLKYIYIIFWQSKDLVFTFLWSSEVQESVELKQYFFVAEKYYFV